MAGAGAFQSLEERAIFFQCLENLHGFLPMIGTFREAGGSPAVPFSNAWKAAASERPALYLTARYQKCDAVCVYEIHKPRREIS